MKIAIIGDRGIPARYSGFSTLVEEIAVRLVKDHDFEVTVYARKHYYETHPESYKGVDIVWLPAPGGKSFESIVHSNLAILHACTQSYDVCFILDPGNGPFCLPLKVKGTPLLYHTDGLGWKRTKWSPLQRKYYKYSEKITALFSDWLITDSRAMVAYYQESYKADCAFIPYGSMVGNTPKTDALERLGIKANEYYLVVARMEPENNTDLIIKEYKKSKAEKPLIVVGGVPYQSEYADAIKAEADKRVKIIGSIYDSGELNGLFQNCYLYIHGHEVGGTNPSLVRAMGANAPCIVNGVDFNREVVGYENPYFSKDEGDLAEKINQFEAAPETIEAIRSKTLKRSREYYRWDAVASAYARLFEAIADCKKVKNFESPPSEYPFYCPEEHHGHFEDWPHSENA